MKRKTLPMTKLTDQQRFLLQQIPGKYEFKHSTEPDTKEVSAARKLVAQFDKDQQKKSCKYLCEVEKKLRKAKDAVYFRDVLEARSFVEELIEMTKADCC